MKFRTCKITTQENSHILDEEQWAKDEQQWDIENPAFVDFSHKKVTGIPIIAILVIGLFIFYLIAVWL